MSFQDLLNNFRNNLGAELVNPGGSQLGNKVLQAASGGAAPQATAPGTTGVIPNIQGWFQANYINIITGVAGGILAVIGLIFIFQNTEKNIITKAL